MKNPTEPETRGTRIAAIARARANNDTAQKRARLLKKGLSLINAATLKRKPKR